MPFDRRRSGLCPRRSSHGTPDMKIASWNVNSLNVRLPHLEQWLRDAQPDVGGLPETKLADEKFHAAVPAGLGYRTVFSGRRTHNGVALLARDRAPDDGPIGQ